jgi:hypothetical protein
LAWTLSLSLLLSWLSCQSFLWTIVCPSSALLKTFLQPCLFSPKLSSSWWLCSSFLSVLSGINTPCRFVARVKGQQETHSKPLCLKNHFNLHGIPVSLESMTEVALWHHQTHFSSLL